MAWRQLGNKSLSEHMPDLQCGLCNWVSPWSVKNDKMPSIAAYTKSTADRAFPSLYLDQPITQPMPSANRRPCLIPRRQSPRLRLCSSVCTCGQCGWSCTLFKWEETLFWGGVHNSCIQIQVFLIWNTFPVASAQCNIYDIIGLDNIYCDDKLSTFRAHFFPGRNVLFVVFLVTTLQWRRNKPDGVSNHRRLDCLLNCLFRRKSNKTAKFRVAGLCRWGGIHRWLVDSPHKGLVTRKMFPFDDAIMILQHPL